MKDYECGDGHPDIIYNSTFCPACEYFNTIHSLMDEITGLKRQIKKMETGLEIIDDKINLEDKLQCKQPIVQYLQSDGNFRFHICGGQLIDNSIVCSGLYFCCKCGIASMPKEIK